MHANWARISDPLCAQNNSPCLSCKDQMLPLNPLGKGVFHRLWRTPVWYLHQLSGWLLPLLQLRGCCCSQGLYTLPITIRQIKQFNYTSAGHCPVVSLFLSPLAFFWTYLTPLSWSWIVPLCSSLPRQLLVVNLGQTFSCLSPVIFPPTILISCANSPGKVLQKLREIKPIRVYRSVNSPLCWNWNRMLSSATCLSHPTRLYYLTKMLIVFCSIGSSKCKERLSLSLQFYRALPQKMTSQTV